MFSKRSVFLIALLGVLGCLGGGYFLFTFNESKLREAHYPITKVVQFRVEVKNEGRAIQKNVTFSVYAPVALTATQKVTQLIASHDYTLEADPYHNQVMHFRFDQLAPFENRVVTVRAELAMTNEPNRFQEMHADKFLQPEKYIESADFRIVAQSQKLAKLKPMDSVKAIYSYVSDLIDFGGYMKEDRGALYALSKKKGDCTEFAYLTNALSRALAIPSRAVGGYVYQGNATFKPRDYHNWAEVFVDGAWRIVDAQNKVFMADQSNFVAMRIIRPSGESLLGNSHQFAYSSDNVSVNMR